MSDTTGVMVSRAVKAIPTDTEKQKVWLEKTLDQHFQDIKTLFDTCTDCDRFEKLQRDNSAS